MVQEETHDSFRKKNMKLSSGGKDKWNILDKKEFFLMATYVCTVGRCYSSLSGLVFVSLPVVRKYIAAHGLFLLI